MDSLVVQAPVSILLANGTPPTARVLALAARALGDGASAGALAAQSGLDRMTVRKYRAMIPMARSEDRVVTMPLSLLADSRVRPQAKVAYGALQTLPSYRESEGQVRYADLAGLLRTSHATAHQVARELARAGWADVRQPHKHAAAKFVLRHPEGERRSAAISRAKQRLEDWEYRGEAICREYLTLLIDSDEFQDNARPGFLANPVSDELLEYDRYYPGLNLAVEFHGPQHFRTTQRFPSADALARLQARDLMKEALSVRRGVRLIITQGCDLKLETMRQKVGNAVPLRDLRGYEELIEILDNVSRDYRWE